MLRLGRGEREPCGEIPPWPLAGHTRDTCNPAALAVLVSLAEFCSVSLSTPIALRVLPLIVASADAMLASLRTHAMAGSFTIAFAVLVFEVIRLTSVDPGHCVAGFPTAGSRWCR